MKIWILLLMVGIICPHFVSCLLHHCPSQEKQEFHTFCSCEKNSSKAIFITCNNIKTDEELIEILLILRKHVIDHLLIKKSGVLQLSSGLFSKQNIHKLVFQEVQFDAVDLFSGLRGLEFHLEDLQFIHCDVPVWIWTKGHQFVFLKTIRFEKTNLPNKLSNKEFEKFPKNVRNLHIVECGIRELGDTAFKKFGHLEYLELDRNSIKKIQRSMFPLPARRLEYISLTGNPIIDLPKNVFQNMSRLEFLLLSHTTVSTLHNETFSPIWEQLEEIYFNNVNLNCDCNTVWMLNVTEPTIFRRPYCASHNYKIMNEISEREMCGTRKNRKRNS